MEANEHGAGRDDASYRQIAAWELRRVAEEVEALKQHRSNRSSIQWIIPALFGVLLSGAVGYIGIVHQLALRNTERVDTVAEVQQRGEYLRNDVEELKKRMLQSEGVAQQLPYLASQVREISSKLDRVLERQQLQRYAPTVP